MSQGRRPSGGPPPPRGSQPSRGYAPPRVPPPPTGLPPPRSHASSRGPTPPRGYAPPTNNAPPGPNAPPRGSGQSFAPSTGPSNNNQRNNNGCEQVDTRAQFGQKAISLFAKAKQGVNAADSLSVHEIRPSFVGPQGLNSLNHVLTNHCTVKLPEVLYYFVVNGMEERAESAQPVTKEDDEVGSGTDTKEEGDEAGAETNTKEEQDEALAEESPTDSTAEPTGDTQPHQENTKLPPAAKQRLMMESLINSNELLRSQKHLYASDAMRQIVSWTKPTTLFHANSVPVDKIVAECEYTVRPAIPSKNLDAIVKTLKLQYKGEIPVRDLNEAAHGVLPQFTIDLQRAQTIAIDRALNVIITKATMASGPDLFRVGSKKIFTEAGKQELSPGVFAHHGFFSNVKVGMGYPLLNVSLATSAFYEPLNVSTYLRKTNNSYNSLKNVKVEISYTPGKTRTIKRFGRPPRDQLFDFGNSQISVLDYLRSKAIDGILLDQIAVSDFLCADMGTYTSPEWYPVEALKIAKHQNVKSLSPEATEKMLEVTSKLPRETLNNIVQRGLATLGVGTQEHPNSVLSAAGIKVSQKPLSIPFHKATFHHVCYGAKSVQGKELVQDVSKTWGLYERRFYDTKIRFVGPVVVLLPQTIFDKVDKWYGKWVVDQLLMQFSETGIQRTSNGHLDDSINFNENAADIVAELKQSLKKAKILGAGIVVLVNPSTSRYGTTVLYNQFKRVADQAYGMHTTCVMQANCDRFLSKPKPYFANIAMKVNIKLGNVNHIVKLKEDDGRALIPILYNKAGLVDTMILGADVTHAQKGSKEATRSLAALVGSVDETFGRYAGSVSYQTQNQEIIDGLQGMAEQRLNAFAARNEGRLPAKILYYRDGVDPGQYPKVRAHELRKIRAAYARVAEELNIIHSMSPLITAVVVTKRHHTRFFPEVPPPSRENPNCKPGTVVDSVVTHPNYFDFFLQSHIPGPGTARPTHYFVLENGMKFTPEQLQNFTNWLCYTYARATLPVGYASPAYYADLLCERVRCYFHDFFNPADPGLRDVGKNQRLGDRELNALKKDTAWERRYDDNGGGVDADGNAVARNDHGPWHRALNDTMFWL